MGKIKVENFELSDDYVERLLHELKVEGIKTKRDLEKYLKDYSYTKDTSLKTHLLVSKNKKKQNFALPFDE